MRTEIMTQEKLNAALDNICESLDAILKRSLIIKIETNRIMAEHIEMRGGLIHRN